MTFRKVARTRLVSLMVSVWPESDFRRTRPVRVH